MSVSKEIWKPVRGYEGLYEVKDGAEDVCK